MFNNVKFLEDVRKVHLLSNEELAAFEAVTDVRNRLNDMALCGFIGDELALIRKSLDDICANFVGETMFRLLVSKMNPQKLKIINIGPEESGRKLIEQLGSSYGNSEVRINLNLYDHAGVGIPERQYYGIDTNKTLVLKPKSVANSLFHEFTHCLHKVENSILYEYYRKHSQKKDQIWSDYEEQRTIAGYFPTGIYDPICENCFNLYDTIVSKTAYIPRIGHWAYMGRDEKKTMLQLSDIYGKLLFKLEWTTIYI